jgi:hypothetical protein
MMTPGIRCVTVLAVLAALAGCTPTHEKGRPAVVATTKAVPAYVPYTPKVADLTVALTIVEKRCFGPAGCNVRYRVTPTYQGLPLLDDQVFTVVYVVSGGESGPQTGSFTLRGDGSGVDPEETIGTRSQAVVLSAKVTDVLPL